MRSNDKKRILTSRNVAELQSNQESVVSMKTAREVSEMLGISKRTLQYYNEIGLLRPSKVDAKTGYWSYGERRIETLKRILILARLKYSLTAIKEMINTKGFDYEQAMDEKIAELTGEMEVLEELVSLSRKIKEQGIQEVVKEEWRVM